MSARHNRVASEGVISGMKQVLAVVALAGTVTFATACSGADGHDRCLADCDCDCG